MPALPSFSGPRLEVNVLDATLVRIFDYLLNTQSPSVHIFRGNRTSGTLTPVAKSNPCQGGDLQPHWQEQFLYRCAEEAGEEIVFCVVNEKKWKSDVLCGEARLDVTQLLDASPELLQGKICELPLIKRNERTGTLRIALCRLANAGSVASAVGRNRSLLSVDGTGTLQTDLTPSTFKDRLQGLLKRPQELEETIRLLFRDMAHVVRGKQRPTIQEEDIVKLTESLACRLKVDKEVFGEVDQMFWRFDFSGDGLLDEEDSVRMLLFMLRSFRNSMAARESFGVSVKKLGDSIEHRTLEDKYTITDKLGQGGQGKVFLATEAGQNQKRVIKTIEKDTDSVQMEELTHEFEILITLRHPKIARVFDIFQDATHVHIVEEAYLGGDLTKAMENAANAGVQITEQWLAGVTSQVLTGVEFLHSKHIIHSDLKEANVMIAGECDWSAPQVVVIDFGLANRFGSRSLAGGTPGYMPPEVWQRGLWTPRGDVFSIGVMIFSMLQGGSPFTEGTTSFDDISCNTINMHPALSWGSAELQDLVYSMMQKNFQRRPSVSKALQDPWFTSQDLPTDSIDTNMLNKLLQTKKANKLRRALVADIAARESLAQLQQLNKLFMELDNNNDGRITVDEIKSALKGRWAEKEIAALVENVIGSSKDGEVSYDEFMGQLLAAREPEDGNLVLQWWKSADTAEEGFLGIEQIKQLLQRPAVQNILGDCLPEQLLQEMDIDGDGRVSFEEFKNAVEGNTINDKSSRGHFAKGQEMEFWSISHAAWVPCQIVEVDPVHNWVQVDCKPGYWLHGQALHNRLRRRCPAS